MFPDQADCLAIRQLMTICGDYAYQQARVGFQVFEKGTDDYVTTVDRALDQRLLAGIQARFPKDGIITEENGATLQRFHQTYPRLWFIDPIDGTADFIQGRADYAVMVGQLVDGCPQAGWIYAPAHGSLYWGGPGRGLFCQHRGGVPRPLIPVEPAMDRPSGWSMVLGEQDRQRFGADLVNALPGVNFLALGSFGLKVMAVISGQAGLYIYLNGRVKLWDTLGPLALAQAAGLTCCDLAGRPIGFTEPDIDGTTMVHRQPIVIGWPRYVEQFRPLVQTVVGIGAAVP